MNTSILTSFYTCVVESTLTSMTVWYASCAEEVEQALQQVVRTEHEIIGCSLLSL